MQLLLGVRGAWKCLEVTLEDGHAPRIGGATLVEHSIEPAQWFKVLVLDSICVDCSNRVISWSVSEGSTAHFSAEAITKSLPPHNSSSPHCKPHPPQSPPPQHDATLQHSLNQLFLSLSLSPGGGAGAGEDARRHTLMAPHDGDCSLCQDDLQALFELAMLLYRVNDGPAPLQGLRGRGVEQRSWLKLLHCFLLPLISFNQDDLAAMETASSSHSVLMAPLDESIAAVASQSMKVKQGLAQLLEQLLPVVPRWAESGQCDHTFLAKLTSDLQHREEDLRSKIHSARRSVELSRCLSMPVSAGLEQRCLAEEREGESLLLQTLRLRALLEETLHTSAAPVSMEMTEEVWRLQRQYVQLHTDLKTLREKAALLSEKKVLTLSVREALEQTRLCLQRGRPSTTGKDRGRLGGSSTDVLSEASHCSSSSSSSSSAAATTEYHTLQDQLQQLLTQQKDSQPSRLHNDFCSRLRGVWFTPVDDGFVLVGELPRTSTLPASLSPRHGSPGYGRRRFTSILKRLSPSHPRSNERQSSLVSGDPSHDLLRLVLVVREHFEKMVEAVCLHLQLPAKDSYQRLWLCYEKLFFHMFFRDFLSLYKKSHAKACERLEMAALAASMLDPGSLKLGVAEPAWLQLFPSRSHEDACTLYQELLQEQPTRAEEKRGAGHFASVTSDLSSLPLVSAPLEKLQLLTSAFRKAMASLSELKLRPVIQANTSNSDEAESGGVVDLSVGVVSCDDLLPVLVLLLLQLPPALLSELLVNTAFLADHMAPFLSPGWHGYSLAAFQSALHIISGL